MRAIDDYSNAQKAVAILNKPNGILSSWSNSDGFGISIKRETDRCYADELVRNAVKDAFVEVQTAFDAALVKHLETRLKASRLAAVDEFAKLMGGDK